jgi:hypothetical protein
MQMARTTIKAMGLLAMTATENETLPDVTTDQQTERKVQGKET